MIMDASLSQLGRGESISDTARVLGRHVAAIVWRTSGQERLQEMADHAGVPVINGLTDQYHPCQVLADLQTIRQRKQQLAGLTLAYVGDGANNMAHSYLLGGSVAGMHVRIGAPPGFQPDPEVLVRARAAGEQLRGQRAGARGGQGSGGRRRCGRHRHLDLDGPGELAPDREAIFVPYALTTALLAIADKEAIVLHCLPAYRGKEIDGCGDRRTAVGGLGRGREPQTRAEGSLGLPR